MLNFNKLVNEELFQLLEAIRISFPSKLGGIPAWSLNAGVTCPESIDPKTKKVKDSCNGCYAKRGHFKFPNVIDPREENRIDWRRPSWVKEMIKVVDRHRYFRWFDSGDAYHPELLEKMYEVMKKSKHTKFWFPTMTHFNERKAKILDKMRLLPNVAVRDSTGKTDGSFAETDNLQSTQVRKKNIKNMDKNVHLCPVGIKTVIGKNGKERKAKTCDECDCLKCYNKKIKKIAYKRH